MTVEAVTDPETFVRTQAQPIPAGIAPELTLYLATEVTPLWQLTEERLKTTNLPPPFWAFAWPGGQGLARYLLDHPWLVKGKRVIDLGAGSGIVAIAAMKAGARSAVAVDIDPMALAAIRVNAALNNVAVEAAEGIDLTKPPKHIDVILAGDICYQQAMSAALLRWLRLCAAKGMTVFLADPGRAYLPDVGLREVARYTVPTSRDLEDQDSRVAVVAELFIVESQ